MGYSPLSISPINQNGQAAQVWGGIPNGPGILIINTDTTNIVYVGTSPEITSGGTNTTSIGPYASVTVNGAESWYAIAAKGTAPVDVMPNGLGYSPGTLTVNGNIIATVTGDVNVTNTPTVNIGGTADVNIQNADIDVFGVGGYINPGQYTTLINDTSGHTIPVSAGAGGAGQYATALQNVMTNQSFNLAVNAYCTSQATASAALTMLIIVTWFADAAGNFPVESDTYWMWLVNSSAEAGNYTFRGGGPAKASYMKVTFVNFGTTATIDVTQIVLIGNGRSISMARFNQPVPLANMNSGETFLSTVNTAAIALPFEYPDGSDGILCNESGNANIAIGGTYWLPMPLYTGPVWCRFSTSVALANDFVLATSAPLLNGNLAPGASSQGVLWNPGNTAGTDYTTTLQLGNAPVYAIFKGGAAIPTITLEIQGVAE